ncbi:MAG: histidine phosphatase family protein [Planctomycetales bacterium]|nr:histidine phosphatase family protein [Planctomycetales bacterium]
MNDAQLKNRIIESLWQVADRHSYILSATLTGSFVNSPTLAGLSDIDFVVVLDALHEQRFQVLQEEFSQAVQPVLEQAGYSFLLNPTLGPLKFNAPRLAVLHLMLYSQEAHVQHVINSPFTCLDWQTSPCYRKRSLAEIYPTFGLQPRHFLSARRSISDYLRDFRGNVVSYRQLSCHAEGYQEQKCSKPMDDRDRHEFAYHVMRFLMLNLLKLVRRFEPQPCDLTTLMDRFFALFPAGEHDARSLLQELADKKRRIDYAVAIEGLSKRLESFVARFEQQFRQAFETSASRHIAFRHAATALNQPPIRFLGRSDPPILPPQSEELPQWHRLQQAVEQLQPQRLYASPLKRCQQSLQRLDTSSLDAASLQCLVDERLIEMDYGACEGLAVSDCREKFPKLFAAWGRGEDPRFPGGENSADVTRRVLDFTTQHWQPDGGNSLLCTHNVVLRSLVGELLGVPPRERFRIHIPHTAAIGFVATKQFGLFVELDESVEREMFQAFSAGGETARESTPTQRLVACKS